MCRSQHWHSSSRGTDHTSEALKDMTGHDYFNPTSLHSRDCKLTTWGCGMGALAHASDFWSDHFILNTDTMKLLVFPMQGTPHHCYPAKWVENPAL